MATGVLALLCVDAVSGYSIGDPECDTAGGFPVLQNAAENEEVVSDDDTSTI